MTDELVVPLAAAFRQARKDRAIDLGEPAQDARLVHHLVFGMLIDLAAQRRTSPPAAVSAVVSLAHRAAVGRLH